MSSLSTRTREVRPVRRARHRVTAGVAAITMSGVAVIGAAVPAQAMPRDCNDIANTVLFFELALEMDYGPSARYYAGDLQGWNRAVRLYYGSHCHS